MTSDSHIFRTSEQLANAGFYRDGQDWIENNGKRYVPLYESKMIHHYDHRWATNDPNDPEARDTSTLEKENIEFEISPRYWVPSQDVEKQLSSKNWKSEWLMGWRNVASAHNLRTMIVGAFPLGGVGHSMPLIFPDQRLSALRMAALIANLSSLCLDFCARQKVGGVNLTQSYVTQFPVLPPSCYTEADLDFILPRVLELSYTSHSMAPFARDLGYDGPPFTWDEDRRAHLRAELDAWYALAYGLTRDELRYVLDPKDVMGEDYPSETFRVLQKNEIAKYGEYRTQHLVLAAYDALVAGGMRPRIEGYK